MLRDVQGDRQLQCSMVGVRIQGHLSQTRSGGTNSQRVEKARQGECSKAARRLLGELLTSSEDLSAPRETQVMRQSQGEGKLGRAPRASQLHYQGYGLQSSNTSITWKLLVVLAPPLPPPPPQIFIRISTWMRPSDSDGHQSLGSTTSINLFSRQNSMGISLRNFQYREW